MENDATKPLAERLAALSIARLAVWVYDHDHGRIRWANARAAEVWRAESVEELLSRDLSGQSEGTRVRLDNYVKALREGRREVAEDWTLYPRGQPTPMTLYGSAVTLDDGRLAILFQALVKEKQIEDSTLRGVEALRHTSLLVSLVTPQGQSLFHNPAALRTFGASPDVGGWFDEADRELLDDAAQGRLGVAELRVNTLQGERWHAIEARPTVDPVTGQPAVLLQQLDVHARREAEDLIETRNRRVDELNESLRLVDEQRRQILALSAPILDIGRHAMAVALIGALDDARFDEIAERLLPAIQERGARHVILDFTGCHALLDGSSSGFERLSHAIVLLGCNPVITGIGPSLASALVASGTSFGGRTVLRTLREGIDYCRQNVT